jgi:hypothetical protein
MGGNLLKTSRKPKSEYNRIVTQLKKEFLDTSKFPYEYYIPESLKDKKDFGDVDIIVALTDQLKEDSAVMRNLVIDNLNIEKYGNFKQGISCLYEDMSIDFWGVNPKRFAFAKYFLSYNVLGNILSRFVKGVNLKLGMDGLYYVYRRKIGNYKKEMFISNNWEQICMFFELSYSDWEKGFTKIELYDWLTKCKYFSNRKFMKTWDKIYQQFNHRQLFIDFADYVKNNDFVEQHYFDLPIDERIALVVDEIDNFFFEEPKVKNLISKEEEKERITNLVKPKFNGNLVMEWTKLKGKKLGSFINSYKKSKSDFNQFILNRTNKQIQEDVNQEFKRFTK